MKFKYGEKQENHECVAYIDIGGDLNIIPTSSNDEGMEVLCINTNGRIHTNLSAIPESARHKFYKGDSVTITF